MKTVSLFRAEQNGVERGFGKLVNFLHGKVGGFDERLQFEIGPPTQPAGERI